MDRHLLSLPTRLPTLVPLTCDKTAGQGSFDRPSSCLSEVLPSTLTKRIDIAEGGSCILEFHLLSLPLKNALFLHTLLSRQSIDLRDPFLFAQPSHAHSLINI